MNKMKLLALFLALAMLLSLAACSASPAQSTGSTAGQQDPDTSKDPVSPDTSTPDASVPETIPQETPAELPVYAPDSWRYGYSLEKVGSFADPGAGMHIYQDALYYTEGTSSKFTTYTGQVQEEIPIAAISYLGKGLYVLASTDEDINSVGLVTKEGEVLIPFEACRIRWASNSGDQETNRYLEVVYTTGITEDASESFIKASDASFSFYPDGETVMYTGYGLVYDTVEKKFVDNVKIGSSRLALYACGSSFAAKDAQGGLHLYNADGKLLVEGNAYAQTTGNAFITGGSKGYTIYNDLGQVTYATDQLIRTFQSQHGYILEPVEEGYAVLDRFGRQVLTGYETVLEEHDHIFLVQQGENYGLVHADGTVLLPCDSTVYPYYEGYGIYTRSYTAEDVFVEDIITLQGIAATAVADLYQLSGEKDGKAFVLQDGDFTLDIGSGTMSPLAFGLGTCDGLLYDLFTGSSLLETQSQYIRIAGDYIYAFDGTNWTIYQLTGPVNAE